MSREAEERMEEGRKGWDEVTYADTCQNLLQFGAMPGWRGVVGERVDIGRGAVRVVGVEGVETQ